MLDRFTFAFAYIVAIAWLALVWKKLRDGYLDDTQGPMCFSCDRRHFGACPPWDAA